MLAGTLNNRIAILRSGPDTDDGFSSRPGARTEAFKRWASWRAANGRELLQNGGRDARTGGSLWIRRDPEAETITTRDQVQFDGRTWEIVGVALLGRDAIEITVAATED